MSRRTHPVSNNPNNCLQDNQNQNQNQRQTQNQNLFLDELVQDFDISLSGFGCDNVTNVSLIRDLNQVISSLGENIKVETIEDENAQDSLDPEGATAAVSPDVKYYSTAQSESPHSNDNSCGSHSSTDSEKRFGKNISDLSDQFGHKFDSRDLKPTKRKCFRQFSAEELSPISSVSSSMESNQRFASDTSQSSQTGPLTPTTPDPNSKNQENSYGYAWRRYSKTDAPSVHNKVSSVQIGKTIKAEPEPKNFQYILGAPTASGFKLGAMTMTYLNQSQPYEIRLKKIATDIPNYDGKNLRSSLRLGFVEKRLHYRETEEMANWCRLHSKDRILDVDFALSYGIFDVQINSTKTNYLEFVWNPNREASIFVKLNCISTEFTSKRHGGERGSPLRLIIETYSASQNIRLDGAQCLVKVFKSKGADRKHKTDRERIAKQPDSSLYYQPSYDCTLLTTFCEDDVILLTSSPPPERECRSSKISSSDSLHQTVQLPTSSTTCYQSPTQSTNTPEEQLLPSTAVSTPLPADASSSETVEWLTRNRFTKLIEVLMNFSSEDLRRLTRDDLIQICGISDGIRLYNSIHAIQSTTRLTIFVTSDGKVHNAIYLKNMTADELKEKLVESLGISGIPIAHHYLIGPNDIKIKLTDEVVMNMKNESIFTCTLDKQQEEINLILQILF